MARAGLGSDYRCLFANDFDAKKGRSYAANWGADVLRVADVGTLTASDLPGRPDLAWASFPCQDLSLAGSGAGLAGARSSAFWAFGGVVHGLRRQGRAPRLIVLENVIGALTARRGADFSMICRALQEMGYRIGAVTIDAAHFLPQSRPRLFVIAYDADLTIPESLTAGESSPAYSTPALRRAVGAMAPDVSAAWVWWALPAPVLRSSRLVDLIEIDPPDAHWHSREQTEAFLAMMSPASLKKLAQARVRPGKQFGALYRRTRPDGAGGRRVRAEVRFDGLAGCLRTPGGGSSRQFLLEVDGGGTRSRLISGREAARLMGLPDTYRLPAKASDAYHLVGDGVAPPVVRFLRVNLITPLLQAQEGARVEAAQ